jgi:DNA-binding NarL/FixJ family response regulator
MIRVVIADDQRVVRDGLVTLIGLIDGVEVIGAASDGAEAVALAAHADVVLMDLNMPGTNGVEATRQIDTARVLVLTTYADDASIFAALEAGARGYLTKDAGIEEIERAIRAVAAGETHLDPAVQARLVAAAVGPAEPRPADATQDDDLTAREAEVLTLIAGGLSNQEIAARLVVSLATVKTHVNRIFAKTGARDRAQAVRYAYRTGRVSGDL